MKFSNVFVLCRNEGYPFGEDNYTEVLGVYLVKENVERAVEDLTRLWIPDVDTFKTVRFFYKEVEIKDVKEAVSTILKTLI